MLTGDKVGTAKNIAAACNILPPDAEILEITTDTFPVLAEVPLAKFVVAQQVLNTARVELQPPHLPVATELQPPHLPVVIHRPLSQS